MGTSEQRGTALLISCSLDRRAATPFRILALSILVRPLSRLGFWRFGDAARRLYVSSRSLASTNRRTRSISLIRRSIRMLPYRRLWHLVSPSPGAPLGLSQICVADPIIRSRGARERSVAGGHCVIARFSGNFSARTHCSRRMTIRSIYKCICLSSVMFSNHNLSRKPLSGRDESSRHDQPPLVNVS